MKKTCMMALALFVNACQTGFVPISQRNMYEKEGKSANLGHRRPIEDRTGTSPDIYIKRQNIEIVPQETKNYTGSLLALKNPDTYLFIDAPRGELGDFLDIAVQVNRKDKAPTPAPGAPADPANAAKGKSVQDDLIAALPKLEPGLADPKTPSSIKMKVVRKLENGDLIVEASRASQNEWEANSQRATARIPYSKVPGRGEISTADLADVHWWESVNGALTERESNTWEDEYSLRWAGFDEARSKIALDLETKRKDLEKVRDRLKDKIVNVGKERNKLAVEKDRVDSLRREAEEKLNELAQKNAQLDAQIEQQKDVIRKQELLIGEVRTASEADSATAEKTPVAQPKPSPVPQPNPKDPKNPPKP